MTAGVTLYVGGHAGTVQGEREDLAGERMFTAAHPPQAARFDQGLPDGVIDSGAFTDAPDKRLTPEGALGRQLAWELWASEIWRLPLAWRASGLVSYDLLIDETWIAGERHKRRWDIREADRAVRTTVEAAAYLSSQRQRLAPRTLILSAQGVDALQYAECAAGVLQHALPGDWFGLGGWCILGLRKSLLPVFWQTLHIVLPMVKVAGLSHVHIFGVTWLPALGGLLALADKYELTVSTDSTGPVLSCTWKDWKKAGARMPYWRDNVNWWKGTLAELRTSPHYKMPPELALARQEVLCFISSAI